MKTWLEKAIYYEKDKIDSCIYFCKKIDSLSQLCPSSFADYIIRANILWADQHSTIEDWDQHLKLTEGLLDDYGGFLDPDSLMKTQYHLQYERCRCEDNKGDYDVTFKCYTKLLADLPDHLSDGVSLRYVIPLSISLVYFEKGEVENAISWCKEAENFLPPDNADYQGYLYDYFGKFYLALGEVDTAENYFRKSIEEFLKGTEQGIGRDEAVDAFTGLVGIYVSRRNWKEAKKYLDQALKLQLDSDWSFAHIYYQYADYYFSQNIFDKALSTIDSAILAAKRIKQGRFYILGQYNSLKGEILAKTGLMDESLDCFQEALFHFTEKFDSGIFTENPDPDDSPNRMGLLRTLDKKAMALFIGYKKGHGQLGFLEWSHSAYQSAISLIKLLRTEYIEDKTKEFLSEQWFQVFESAIATADLLYKKTGKLIYLENAFKFSETSKALSLLENLTDIEAKQFADIPDEIIGEEFSIKARINRLENNLREARTKKIEDRYRTSLIEEKTIFAEWIKNLENKYPSYFELKYNTAVATLQDVKRKLSKNKALIEYFYGEKKMYAFGITNDEVVFHSFPITAAFENSINVLINATSNRKGLTSEHRIKKFLKHGYVLYKKLIAPFELKEKKIIIIPDGRLNNLPFAAIPIDEEFFPEPNQLHYLLEKHIITTNYSASVMFRQKNKSEKSKNGRKPLLIIAPEKFPKHSDLQLNIEELEQKFAGKVQLMRNPNKEETLNALKLGFENIFIFTHASASGKEPHLQLFNDTLLLAELYANPISSNMVLLGACETGLGKNQKGEGVLSLARGFAYQNVPNTLMTLWKVRERTSYKLSIDFLDMVLNKKMSRTEALHQIQLNLSKAHSGENLPFFWAGFVLVGE